MDEFEKVLMMKSMLQQLLTLSSEKSTSVTLEKVAAPQYPLPSEPVDDSVLDASTVEIPQGPLPNPPPLAPLPPRPSPHPSLPKHDLAIPPQPYPVHRHNEKTS